MSEKQTNTTAAIQEMQALFRAGKFIDLSKRVKNLRSELDTMVDTIKTNAAKPQEPAKVVKEEAKKPVEQKPQERPAKPQQPTAPVVRTRQFNTDDQNRRFSPRPQGFGGPRPQGPRPQGGPKFAGNKPFGPKPTEVPAALDISTKKSTARKKDSGKTYEDKKVLNKKAQLMRGYVEDETFDEDRNVTVRRSKAHKTAETFVAPAITHAIITKENLTVKDLSEAIGKPVTELISKFMILGMMVNINSNIDFAAAELIAGEFGITLEQKLEQSAEEKLNDMFGGETDDEKDLEKRPPVVTVMGHVDHGKTSLLDAIRKTNVIGGEAGGITQHIGAYTITLDGKKITFIDTPGHAAFSAMRARGAQVTDVAVLVVAADDGIMPQTIEAIKHIRAAGVPMVVAINKIDKPDANVQKVKSALLEHDVVSTEWGGNEFMVPISAKNGIGIDELLETILLVADDQNLRANPNRAAKGTVIEALLDKGKGPVATVLVQNGTLKRGDNVVAGTATGKVRAMIGDSGKQVKSAGPSIAVEILGLSSVPKAGDSFYVVDEKMAKRVADERKNSEKLGKIKAADLSVESLMDRMQETEFKHYNVIVKGDVHISAGLLPGIDQSSSSTTQFSLKSL